MLAWFDKEQQQIKRKHKPVKRLTILSNCDDLPSVLELLNSYKTDTFSKAQKDAWSKMIKMVTENIEKHKFKLEQENYRSALKEQKLHDKEQKRLSNQEAKETQQKVLAKEKADDEIASEQKAFAAKARFKHTNNSKAAKPAVAKKAAVAKKTVKPAVAKKSTKVAAKPTKASSASEPKAVVKNTKK